MAGSGFAEPAQADAASYIRTLFDATIVAPPTEGNCRHHAQPPFAELARFGAGQHWRRYDSSSRAAFDLAFCHFAMDALTRLRQRFPDITLTVIDSQIGPRGMIWVRSTARADGQDWPVIWLVGNPDTAPYLADLKVMGISLGILLRGLTVAAVRAVEAPQADLDASAVVGPDAVIAPWRQALDLAMPASANTP